MQNVMILAASAGTSYINSITKLKTVLTTVGVAMGGVFLAYGAIRFAISWKNYDQQGEHQSIYTVVAGGALLGLSALVAALT